MSNLAEAYDFALFEEKEVRRQRYEASAAAPAKKHSKSAQKPRQQQNIVRIPKKELKKNRRLKISPLKATVWLVSFCVILGLVMTMVHSQVQLTELTNEFNAEVDALNESISKEIYLNAKNLSKYDLAEVETYATETLGMTKMNEGQITYVNLMQEDGGVVLQETNVSGLTSFLNTIKSWFA